MRAQLGRVSCQYPPHDKALGGPVTVRTYKGRAPGVGTWNHHRVADMGGTDSVTAAKVDGHVGLVRPAWRYSAIPGCEEIRLHRILEKMDVGVETLWPLTERYAIIVSVATRRLL